MDPSLVIGITTISTISLGLITKLILLLRKNIRSCGCIQFRSVENSDTSSPRIKSLELNQIKTEIKNIRPNITPNIRPNIVLTSDEKIKYLENKLKEAEDKLKMTDNSDFSNDDRIYI